MSDDDLDFMPVAPGGENKPAEGAPTQPRPAPAPAAKPTGEGGGDHVPGERAELPTWNRSRRKRKPTVQAELEDDALHRGVRKARRQVIDTPKLAIGVIAILTVGIAGGVWLSNRNVARDAESSRVLQQATAAIVRGQVIPAEEQEQNAEAIKTLRFPIYASEDDRQAAIAEALAAAEATPSKRISVDATLVAATQAMRAGDFDTAISQYDSFLDATGSDHPLRFLALEGKGNALEGKRDYEGALAVFQQLAPHPSDYNRSMALYHQGRVLESLERKDEALAIYQQFFEEFPNEQVATAMVRARVEKLDPNFAARLAPPASPVSVEP